MSTKNLKLTASDIDWSKIKVYDQKIAGLILGDTHIIKEYDVPQELHQLHGINVYKGFIVKKNEQEFLIPVTSEFPAGPAFKMVNTYSQLVEDQYEKPIMIKKSVADDIFFNKTEVQIFLGEGEEGIVFMIEDKEEKYYIISNCDNKIEIERADFFSNRNIYNNALKSKLDAYIQKQLNDPTESNTKRFTLADAVYNKCVEKQDEDPTLNIGIACYPAIHMASDVYKYRLTFIMILGKYNGTDFTPFDDVGVYDRNGLCPPGNC